jgi:hypothetical protein
MKYLGWRSHGKEGVPFFGQENERTLSGDLSGCEKAAGAYKEGGKLSTISSIGDVLFIQRKKQRASSSCSLLLLKEEVF